MLSRDVGALLVAEVIDIVEVLALQVAIFSDFDLVVPGAHLAKICLVLFGEVHALQVLFLLKSEIGRIKQLFRFFSELVFSHAVTDRFIVLLCLQ